MNLFCITPMMLAGPSGAIGKPIAPLDDAGPGNQAIFGLITRAFTLGGGQGLSAAQLRARGQRMQAGGSAGAGRHALHPARQPLRVGGQLAADRPGEIQRAI
jgi:hypothetical protein